MPRLPVSLRASLLSPTGIAAGVLGAFFVVVGLLGPSIWNGRGSTINVDAASLGSSWHHPFGTDQLGRDTFARTLAATQLSLKLTIITVVLAAVIGISIGAAVGVLGRRSRAGMGAFIKLTQTFPPVLVAIFVVTIIGPGQTGVVVAIAVAIAPQFARTAQALAATVADSDYMAAARVAGIRPGRRLRRYVLPNTAEPLVLQTSSAAASTLVTIAAFSYLGLGVQLPQYDWGRMLAEGLPRIYTSPLESLAPGAAITLAGVTFSLLGEAVARSLNPASRSRVRRSRRLPVLRFARRTTSPASAGAAAIAGPVLVVENFRVTVPRDGATVAAVAGVDLTVGAGELVGIVGESGSGKTMLCLGISDLLPHGAAATADRLDFLDSDLLTASRKERASLLGLREAMVFQDPMSSLNPSLRIGPQIAEKAEVHMGVGRRAALALAELRLGETQIPAPRARLRQYPHEFSGGMRQRAMIAMGLITNPALIIADEPTTALDVTVQAQILELLRTINRDHGTAVLFISHDIAVVGELCSRVIVMYAGRVVEEIAARDLAADGARHPYTRALMSTLVDLQTDPTRPLAMIAGQPSSLGEIETGCPFAPRCPLVMSRCTVEEPPLEALGTGRVACFAATGEDQHVSAHSS